MNRAIALLSYYQMRNSVRAGLVAPRKLIPLVLLVLLLFSQPLIKMGMETPGTPQPYALAGAVTHHEYGPDAFQSALFLLLVLLAIGVLDQGYRGGSLVFSAADIDYLFTTPFSRRMVLAYRIPAMLFQPLMLSLIGGNFLLPSMETVLAPGHLGLHANISAALGLFLCFSGYTFVGLAMELFFLTRGRSPVRIGFSAAAVSVIGLILLTAWLQGIPGVADLGVSHLMTTLFAPCKLAASMILGTQSASAVWVLLLFFSGALALVFAVRADYYESAAVTTDRLDRVREAIHAGDIGTAFQQGGAGKARAPGREYALPPFGKGAAALLWAHLSVACKQAILNFAGPFLAGVAVAVAVDLWLPMHSAGIIATADIYYFVFATQIAGQTMCRRAIQLQPIIRPLPLRPWRVIAADIAPAAFTSSLFGWGAAIPLLASGHAKSVVVGMLLIWVAPIVVANNHLIKYTVTFWYPKFQDKLQQFQSTLVQTVLSSVVLACLAPFFVLAVHFDMRIWLSVLFALTATIAAAGICFYVAERTYAAYQPRDGGSPDR